MFKTDLVRSTLGSALAAAAFLAGLPGLALALIWLLPRLQPGLSPLLAAYPEIIRAALLGLFCALGGGAWGKAMARLTHFRRPNRVIAACALAAGIGGAAVSVALSRAQPVMLGSGLLAVRGGFAAFYLAGLAGLALLLGLAAGAALGQWRAAFRLAVAGVLVVVIAFSVGYGLLMIVGPRLPWPVLAFLWQPAGARALASLVAALAWGAVAGEVFARQVAVSLAQV